MNIWTIIGIIAIVIFVVIPSFKDRSMPVSKLVISPAIFMYCLYDSINRIFIINAQSLGVIAAGIVLGIIIGMATRAFLKIKADRSKHLIWLPGGYLGLATFLIIFAVHFVIGYLQATQPSVFTRINALTLSAVFILTVVSSMTVGASLCLYYKYRRTPVSL